MTRHPAMAAASAEDPGAGTPGVQETTPDIPVVKEPVERLVLPTLKPEVDPERYEMLARITTLRGIDKRFAGWAIEVARRLWCLTAVSTAYTDHHAVRAVARYLALDAARLGAFSYKASLRRANVQAHLKYLEVRRGDRGLRTLMGQLYAVGRLVHPGEYPAPQSLAQPHHYRTPAASLGLVEELYALAPILPTALSGRLFTVLDCCLGAGARPADFKELTGNSITEARWDGDTVAVVRLPNLAGGTRLVPVGDAKASERLLALADYKKSEYLLGSAGGHVERNAVNRVAENLRTRGYPGVDAVALRNRWVLDMAARIPAALLLQLSDSKTTQLLSDQRDQLPTFGLQHAIALTKENVL